MTESIPGIRNPVVGGADKGNPGVPGVGRAGACSECGKNEGSGVDNVARGSAVSSLGVSTSTVVGRLLLLLWLGRLLVSLRRVAIAEGAMLFTGEVECVAVALVDKSDDSDASGLSMKSGRSLDRRIDGEAEPSLGSFATVDLRRKRFLPFSSTATVGIVSICEPKSTDLDGRCEGNGNESRAEGMSDVDLCSATRLKESARLKLNGRFGGTGGGIFSTCGGANSLGINSRLGSSDCVGKWGRCSKELTEASGLKGAYITDPWPISDTDFRKDVPARGGEIEAGKKPSSDCREPSLEWPITVLTVAISSGSTGTGYIHPGVGGLKS